jgi:hypothetical protein
VVYLSKETSTVEYFSNIQIVDTSVHNDTKYMAFVHDPFALDKMSELINIGSISYTMTNLQNREMAAASKHCTYAFVNDYPWGTVEVNGEKKVVCKCINKECSHFVECRKGASAFREDELIIDQMAVFSDKNRTKALSESIIIGKTFKDNLLEYSMEHDSEQEKYSDINTTTYMTGQFKSNKYDEIKIDEIVIDDFPEKELFLEKTVKNEESDMTNFFTLDSVLEEFQKWMLNNDYKASTASGYVNGVRSANKFGKKKGNWANDICAITNSNDLFKLITALEKSAYFNSSMSNYIISLNCYAEFLDILNLALPENKATNTDAIEIETSYIEEQDWSNNVEEVLDFQGKGFEKFIETKQDTVIFAVPEERIIVNAGPGTGKTYTLIEKLIYMVEDQEVDPEEILVLCFSRAAVEVIEKRLQIACESGRIGMNWHSIDIRTFDSFATHVLSYVLENERHLLYESFSLESLDYDARIGAATEVIKINNELIEQCTHLVVDEVQDLVGMRAQFVQQLIVSIPNNAGYTLLGDACQSIYDYQIKNGDVDSIKFYSWLFKSQCNVKFWSFGINYRQVSELEILGNNYREAILTGDNNDRKLATNSIFENIEELSNINLKNVDMDEIYSFVGDEKLGILTRTNGQALKISTWFRNSGIPHSVQKRLTDYSLNVWIANIFREYENETIDKEMFMNLYLEKGDFGIEPDGIWNAIEKTQYEAKNKYYIRDILFGILNNAKTREFYSLSGDAQITISNIHRSKGREFENVILLNDSLFVEKAEQKDLLEHKVTYVAVTRAKKKIYRTSITNQFIRTDKNGERRAFATGYNKVKKKPNLSHIEIGRAYDIDIESFADDFRKQKIFDQPEDIIGERVVLIKNKEQSERQGYICYDICLEDSVSGGILGRTSKKFFLELRRILKDICGLSNNVDVYEKIYPNRFSDIYVEDIISVISSVSPQAIAGKRYKDLMVWKGITLVGFAQVERDSY